MRQDEHNAQVMLFNWAHWESIDHPELDLIFAIPNGGARDKVTGARLKQEGVRAGVPDICLPVARQGYHGLFIELKAGDNKPSKEQRAWLEKLESQGYLARVCNGVEAAKTLLRTYLEGGQMVPPSD